MNIALIAHDQKKPIMIELTEKYLDVLSQHTIYTTGTTGKVINEKTGLVVNRLNSGPLGGDQQIGAMISEQKIELVIFLRDPLAAQPHEPDVNALIRLCDVYNIPLATNIGTAEVLLNALPLVEAVEEGAI
ncbi:methylglyoxal synthase [Globicatella sanguinis]|uniref:methylglyoxal synthase n=1 Tax=Globicatella sanguinis TaxID=13076 RepID=UPI000826B360|nr:methylglyoxal synthase [Globicatella sanguinis]MDK7631017.1 methylglyoxal synthase [Globicatella sanguinis]WIK67563.1 methylglyoxal synthase [Globicatella sanguinis]WKT56968.1 methylglyoxal synthase [Globicatella sanguinis]